MAIKGKGFRTFDVLGFEVLVGKVELSSERIAATPYHFYIDRKDAGKGVKEVTRTVFDSLERASRRRSDEAAKAGV